MELFSFWLEFILAHVLDSDSFGRFMFKFIVSLTDVGLSRFFFPDEWGFSPEFCLPNECRFLLLAGLASLSLWLFGYLSSFSCCRSRSLTCNGTICLTPFAHDSLLCLTVALVSLYTCVRTCGLFGLIFCSDEGFITLSEFSWNLGMFILYCLCIGGCTGWVYCNGCRLP